MLIDDLFERMRGYTSRTAIFEQGRTYSYGELLAKVARWEATLDSVAFSSKQVIALQSDFSFQSIALLLALFKRGHVVALLSPNVRDTAPFYEGAFVEHLFSCSGVEVQSHELDALETQKHVLLQGLEERSHAGFIIFSSGTTGRPKAILHDLEKFLTSYVGVSKAFNTLAFLLFDHIAGVDTLLYTLSSGGSLAVPEARTPESVCRLIADVGVEVLPVSPSFLNLLLISGAYRKHDLSSLKTVSYGSEPINSHVLDKLPEIFSQARIIQKYGTSEFGSPRSKTRDDSSAWMKLDSERFQTKVIDGLLWVKANSTMLGYLNAVGMLEQDGWLCTGDMVELDGEWMRILGRKSDIINVGGEKVFPVEVEAVLSDVLGVVDSMVYGEAHVLLGNQVCVKVCHVDGEDTKELKKQIRKHCSATLERYKVPSKFVFSTEKLTNQREKKQRSVNQSK